MYNSNPRLQGIQQTVDRNHIYQNSQQQARAQQMVSRTEQTYQAANTYPRAVTANQQMYRNSQPQSVQTRGQQQQQQQTANYSSTSFQQQMQQNSNNYVRTYPGRPNVTQASSVANNRSMLNYTTSVRPSGGATNNSGIGLSVTDRPPQELADKVRMKILPFYDIEDELIKQKPLVASRMVPVDQRSGKYGRVEATLNFGLTLTQCSKISSSKEIIQKLGKIEYGYQLQLRFAALNTAEEQEDEFPPQMILKMNNRPVPLPALIPSNYPGQPPKQPSKPLNVTIHAKLRPSDLLPQKQSNTIVIQWIPDTNNKNWIVSLNLVKKLNADDLFERMKLKGYLDSTATRALIADIMKADDNDPDMALTTLKVSVACPVGKSRMTYPCRSSSCRHIQCFDAVLYLQMSEKKPVWSCPVCNKKIRYDTISIDQYFVDVIDELPSNSTSNDIEINADGSWKVIETENESNQDSKTNCNKTASSGHDAGNLEIEYISIEDSSDDDSPPPPKKQEPSKPLAGMITSRLVTATVPSLSKPPGIAPSLSFGNCGNDDVEVICLSD